MTGRIPLLPTKDARLLFAARALRLFAFGLLSIVLVLYLTSAGIDDRAVGLLLTLSLFGDAAVSLFLTTRADRRGRKRMLVAGAMLIAAAGIAFASTRSLPVLVLAAILGILSPSGGEVGPFIAIEQAALAQVVSDRARTRVFAWYSLVGSLATASGALAGGALASVLQRLGWSEFESYRAVIFAYAAIGASLTVLFTRLSHAVETAPSPAASAPASGQRFGLKQSRPVVVRLSALFGLDAFAGGFIVQSILAYWFHLRFGLDPAILGTIFFWANLLAGLSALAAARIAARIGLIRTMVFTHLPSNVLLLFLPLMPSAPAAIGLLLARSTISQMDVPTRQSYTMAVVIPEERAAAAGVIGVSRSVGTALSPVLAGICVANPALTSLPFFLAGGLKIVYDLLIYRGFSSVRVPEGEGVS